MGIDVSVTTRCTAAVFHVSREFSGREIVLGRGASISNSLTGNSLTKSLPSLFCTLPR